MGCNPSWFSSRSALPSHRPPSVSQARPASVWNLSFSQPWSIFNLLCPYQATVIACQPSTQSLLQTHPHINTLTPARHWKEIVRAKQGGRARLNLNVWNVMMLSEWCEKDRSESITCQEGREGERERQSQPDLLLSWIVFPPQTVVKSRFWVAFLCPATLSLL